MDYAAVAAAIEHSEAACRQLASRAREHVREDRPRYPTDEAEARQLADAFVVAAATGDVTGFAQLLAEDAVYYTDGGGKRRAALNPIIGKERIVQFYEGLLKKGSGAFSATQVQPATLNGLPGFVFHTAEGIETMAMEIAAGKIVAIYQVRNPDKVRHLS
ncbi:MAG TPA: nuclear transport factor 2 family protein [Polyangia bacterium]|jgi:RNA polymerase sigma-70 factor (ECF subfamily)|nr:nuclear transport factor 2 family protein [Polyangia bacterium]